MRRIAVGDFLSAVVAAVVGYLIRFAPEGDAHAQPHASRWLIALLPVMWIGVITAARSYEERFLWVGPEEFQRVFFAAVLQLAAVGTLSWAFRLELARGFVVVALPLAALLTLANRYGQRKWLHRRRAAGDFMQTAIIVGHRNGVVALHEQIEREAYHGYRVIGCCLPPAGRGEQSTVFDGLPVLGTLDEVVDVVHEYEVDTVAVLPSEELDGPALRRLGWDLEKTAAELLLAPAVTEIAGTRVRIRPVAGLPLLHMERPELRGVRRFTKESFDRTAAVGGLLLLLPVMLALAVAVAVTSSGEVFFRQERVGRDGQTFGMLKFRSMVAGADRLVPDLADGSDGNGVLFKMRADPRVTRVGKVLRRYSLDELPQLLNVVRGDMSLVGPRPPLPTEVERYGFDMHRRFLVKPGITGLWQVSGRSDLSWDDSVRIDVRYVENWSLAFDFMILWKTFGAVFRGSGAY
ncbi:Undecaprenyl-phosphate galactose phosphotransferase, WbaP/exopolysaccharide biosynthesis polyprenyl glycosylphosphotransferase [Modestobacter sp. DSM 44400]|uniref:sugar transferase n=1 Tax=Modestobacter sp. DSM 44400 TaxID=1550230 RepID=UPI0008986273|nr:sugar transferase [Modestobacter sp. DSM 44400]SDY66779.1 Undecaprenyl-phosphate galactose phosphotransferase, WbaP/exopolysaccharide biosynthesis polyprenyl glycosylphosphotransferase [Modestobacter sp. DSM 44400]